VNFPGSWYFGATLTNGKRVLYWGVSGWSLCGRVVARNLHTTSAGEDRCPDSLRQGAGGLGVKIMAWGAKGSALRVTWFCGAGGRAGGRLLYGAVGLYTLNLFLFDLT